MIVDACEMAGLDPRTLWSNYVEAMDAAVMCSNAGDRESAYYYVCVVRVTLEHYFDSIERELNR